MNNQTKRKNKKLLGDLHEFPNDIMAIGRLDEKSEGLLILTSDGKYSEYIRSSSIIKSYYVLVDGIISDEALNQLEQGVLITVDKSSYLTKPCNVFFLENHPPIPDRFVRNDKHGPTSWISISISEGKFRQVRKMTAAVGFPTLRLVRYKIGNMELEKLQPGGVEEIYPEY